MALKSTTLPRNQLQQVLNLLRHKRHVDFGDYKPSTLARRVEHRMRERKSVKVADYCELLEREPAEIDALIEALLIKVTDFFRDPPLWEKLRRSLLPELMVHASEEGELRAWSAGCATGEEAYSLAILLFELNSERKTGLPFRVFGTDRDPSVISFARRGIYNKQQVQSVSPRTLERWFERVSEGYAVRKDLRRSVVFGVHDVVNDAPISRLDLILCRNLFIYLDAVAQRRALLYFHHGLKPGGLLALGKSELIPFADKLFTPVDLQSRIYRRLEVSPRTLAYQMQARTEPPPAAPPPEPHAAAPDSLIGITFKSLNEAVAVLSREGTVLAWNDAAARLWGRSEADVVGRRLGDLNLEGTAGERLMERAVNLRSAQVHVVHETFTLDSERPRTIRLEVTPLRDGQQNPVAFMCAASDISELQEAIGRLREAEERQRETAAKYQTANEELQSTNEELETTNEELQSANEELQTTNEELQSTNEELETINEELQSTNASLDVVNGELSARSDDLNRVNLSQHAIIRAISAAVIATDAEGRITTWNPAAEQLFGRPLDHASNQNFQRLSLLPIPRAVSTRIKRAFSRKAMLRIDEFLCKVKGHQLKMRCSLVPLADGAKSYYGAMLIIEPAANHRHIPLSPGGAAPKVAGIAAKIFPSTNAAATKAASPGPRERPQREGERK